ncbi:hypothetical protein A8F94_16955 [Bacillus sp. FJAT-27225]|uniref:AtpZ/AtpI family protein n=1 Tax=Bacillus sp. FJAT-27225 TaxID=1743144 RepID=UPI00080C334D|nr:AtpZ/AtpI family protein [Bacillus sp. FJAT-27225]OCA84391.1 hypothetical protein A8F94_16955 [Bacillus sp. FJAT-27225]
MKKTFSAKFGRTTEDLELGLEEKLIYIHYKKGNHEKSACILKSEDKPLDEYLYPFLEENNVSDTLKSSINDYLKNVKDLKNQQWSEFSIFLMKALSLHMVFAFTIAIAVFLGYQGGSKLDEFLGIYPLFTVIGLIGGISLGGFTTYSMAIKYFKPAASKVEKRKQKKDAADAIPPKEWPEVDVSLDEVRQAIRKFADGLAKGIYRTILVNDDNSIDFLQLAHILGGIPKKKFYMSKETYDLFEECDKAIAVEMDKVQRAVDLYVKEKREYPMLKFDPSKRVNYYQLLQGHYLKELPEIQFYITDVDGLVSHIRPSQTKRG